MSLSSSRARVLGRPRGAYRPRARPLDDAVNRPHRLNRVLADRRFGQSITASVPSQTALATRCLGGVATGWVIIDSSICVAVFTARRARGDAVELLLRARTCSGGCLHAEIAAGDIGVGLLAIPAGSPALGRSILA